MNVNIVLSVRGRKVIFNPHTPYFKWKIMLPIERIEVISEKSHHFECVGYVPRIYQSEMPVEINCDNWSVPECDKVVLPIRNSIMVYNQLAQIMPDNCHSCCHIDIKKIEQYVKYLRGNRR